MGLRERVSRVGDAVVGAQTFVFLLASQPAVIGASSEPSAFWAL